MRHSLRVASLLSATAIALVACGDPPAPAPTAPSNALSSASATALALTCDFVSLKSNARDYAASNKDELFTIIGDLQSLSKNGPNAGATDKAFDGLARLAAMRGTSAQKSTATGDAFNNLTTGFLGCMESYITSTVPSSFSVAGALGDGWMYEVRGKDLVDGAAGSYERGASPNWAAEAPHGWGASISASSQAKRFLIYGFRLPNFITNDPKVGSAFEIATIPTIASGALTFSSPLTIGLCDVDITSTLRLQHVSTILPMETLDCAAPPSFAARSASLELGALNPLSLARRAVAFLTPQQLHAAFLVGGVGGAASELSPSAVIDMQSVTVAYGNPIANGLISRPLADTNGDPVRVRVTTLNGSPLPGVMVTIGIAGNSSSIAFFQDGTSAPSSVVTRATGADGIATFTNVFLTKAGGYQLVATGSFDGVAGAPSVSNLFNMQNK
ncbi:MAG TPA: hypothetical protein VIQ74_04245 [Gemmatimonadaceae bacterium]